MDIETPNLQEDKKDQIKLHYKWLSSKLKEALGGT